MIRKVTFQVPSHSEILWFCGFPQISQWLLLLKDRIVGRNLSQLFCRQGHGGVMNLKPCRAVLFSMCSFFRFRYDCFRVWLVSPVCQTPMSCQKAIALWFSQHILMGGKVTTTVLAHSSITTPANGCGNTQSSCFLLWSRQSPKLSFTWTSDLSPSILCIFPGWHRSHQRYAFSIGLVAALIS